MTRKRLILPTLLGILLTGTPVGAKQWRGITPLHSTRADVQRILGQPPDASRQWWVYQTDEAAVSIYFSHGAPCGSNAENEWRVPKGTVVSITVAPRTIILLSALNIDQSKYQKLIDPHDLKRIEYLNKDDGEVISVSHNEVTSFTYFAAAKDLYLRCPGSRPPEPDPTPESYSLLDTYGNLRFRDEKARLDNFAIALQQRRTCRGYIVGYPAGRASFPSTLVRLKRARNYLMNVRGIEAKRLVTSRGGFRKQFTVELFIVPKGAVAPSPQPPLNVPKS